MENRVQESEARSGFGKLIIKNLVTENYKTAEVFEKYGIDFCCKGNRPIEEACREKGIDMDALSAELETAIEKGSQEINRYSLWEPDYLAQYIVNNHHAYVKTAIPQTAAHLSKVVNAHGSRHPYIHEVAGLFAAISRELLAHMEKEEVILFPMISQLTEIKKSGSDKDLGQLAGIGAPIRAMIYEHDNAGEILEKIRHLTENYTLPADACTTFALTYRELEEFEKDLHKHVFLENSILFTRALEMAKG
ncbi:MAG: iron-sulfur cluster repair di-iron protein [Ignavibacteriales bacterium]